MGRAEQGADYHRAGEATEVARISELLTSFNKEASSSIFEPPKTEAKKLPAASKRETGTLL